MNRFLDTLAFLLCLFGSVSAFSENTIFSSLTAIRDQSITFQAKGDLLWKHPYNKLYAFDSVKLQWKSGYLFADQIQMDYQKNPDRSLSILRITSLKNPVFSYDKSNRFSADTFHYDDTEFLIHSTSFQPSSRAKFSFHPLSGEAKTLQLQLDQSLFKATPKIVDFILQGNVFIQSAENKMTITTDYASFNAKTSRLELRQIQTPIILQRSMYAIEAPNIDILWENNNPQSAYAFPLVAVNNKKEFSQFQGQSLIYNFPLEQIILQDNISIRYPQFLIYGDKLEYNKKSGTVKIFSLPAKNVSLILPSYTILSNQMIYNALEHKIILASTHNRAPVEIKTDFYILEAQQATVVLIPHNLSTYLPNKLTTGDQIEKILLKNNVYMRTLDQHKKKITIQANSAHINPRESTAVLNGQVHIQGENYTLYGEQATFNLKTHALSVKNNTSGKNPKLIFQAP